MWYNMRNIWISFDKNVQIRNLENMNNIETNYKILFLFNILYHSYSIVIGWITFIHFLMVDCFEDAPKLKALICKYSIEILLWQWNS